ncbi:TIGR00730 family Rossman fold protein [Bacillus carboniphilus]|uniref:Cytokinin riboside 5'-monophosphate phosphoribohydrolase n=1 Tax=Bacillus carboniphilus TaxID=86663 RepID=A0ABY9JZI9_9BACI|nr:TIGR00730 family Rossman fold protein [Bacillus carboniphilus]WLR43010.1 TIGR00730 family Rossman fold protein [Bacillus carboniphilus]
MKSICIFAGSNKGNSPQYEKIARELGAYLASHHYKLIYGGSKIGLMGELANEMVSNGGEVIGIMPSGLLNGEVVHREITSLVEVNDMHERKAKMNELADGFIALPGGFGTFEELFEVLSWSKIGIHTKPIGLLNIDGYFDPFIDLIDNSISSGFASPIHLKLITTSESPQELITSMLAYEWPAMEKKWRE